MAQQPSRQQIGRVRRIVRGGGTEPTGRLGHLSQCRKDRPREDALAPQPALLCPERLHHCVAGIYKRIYVPADLLSCAGRDGTGLRVSSCLSCLLWPLAQWRSFTPTLAQSSAKLRRALPFLGFTSQARVPITGLRQAAV